MKYKNKLVMVQWLIHQRTSLVEHIGIHALPNSFLQRISYNNHNCFIDISLVNEFSFIADSNRNTHN